MIWKTPLLLGGIVLATCVVVTPAPAFDPTPLSLVKVQQTRVVPRTQSEITLSFAPVVKQAAPAVVNIYTRKVVERRESPFADKAHEHFLEVAKVALSDGRDFGPGGDGFVRLNFATSRQVLTQILDQMEASL